jgi:very-short-patch-repair endonuclease
LAESVADLDQVLKAGLIDRDALVAALRARRDNGIVVARQAERLATGVADSIPESQLRVHLVLAGLDPVAQHWIEVDGEQVAQVDFAFPARKVAVEYDGGWRNNEMWALNHDRVRLNRIQAAGWDVVFVTAALLRQPRKLIAEVRGALAR